MNALIIIACAGALCMMAEVFNFKKMIVPVIALALILAFGANLLEWNQNISWFNSMLRMDNYAIAFSELIIVTTLLWLIISKSYFNVASNTAEHASIILFALAGGLVMIGYNDLTMLFLGIEILSISLYILAGSDKRNMRSNEAGLKYFLMGAFATGFLLFGIALIYGATGTFNLNEIADKLSVTVEDPSFIYAGILLIMIGLAFKVGAVPFHFWTPDVYEGSPTLITAFMATVVKTAAFAAFFRLFSTCFQLYIEHWAATMAVIAALTMLIGNVLAVYQQSLKRMLAYSSIAHAGYLLIAIVSMNADSAGAILFYATAYSLSSLGAFALLHSLGSDSENISSLKGLAKSNPLLAVVAAITMLSLAGIPPIAGFFGKYYIFYGAMQSGYTWLVLLAIVSSLIGVYYYFRVIYTMFQPGEVNLTVAFSHRTLIIITALASVVIGILPSLIQGIL